MIGVIPKADQIAVAEEFFQLFKTPWEIYEQGRTYDVVVATSDEIPEVDTRLLVIYGSEVKSSDARNSIGVGSRRRGRLVGYRGRVLPIYGELLTFDERSTGIPCVTADGVVAGLKLRSGNSTVLRLGYDLFREVEFLLSVGQPVENAQIPTLEMHIMMLRDWILDAGITLLEIPPSPSGHGFAVCLTHDIDFLRIRDHKFDHTMWGFVYRSTAGTVRDLVRRRISWRRLLRSWRAAVSLPFVHFGWAKDFWLPFDWYLKVEENLPSTYFLIPFKRRAGDRVPGKHAKRRATSYDITDIPEWTMTLIKAGCELGVHGIDAWHSAEKGRDELARIAAVTGESSIGIRMHWLLHDENTLRALDDAGYSYDSTSGYNETIGYRSGTTQTYRPFSTRRLLELPLHIQDGAMFYPKRLDLSEPEAWKRCVALIGNARKFGGVLTILWHDRSHGPERFWGDFYVRLVQALRSLNGWFGTASQVVSWFRKRREVRFDRAEAADGTRRTWLRYHGDTIQPPLTVRVHLPYARGNNGDSPCATTSKFVDIPWNGETAVELDELLRRISGFQPSHLDLSAEVREAADVSHQSGSPDSSRP
jgi:hypothetical protein